MQKALPLVGLAVIALSLQAQTGYEVTARYPVPGDGGFDYVTLDAAARRIYIAHESKVDVLDADSGKFTGSMANTPGVHGVALAPEFHHAFASDGDENKVLMFDPVSLREIKRIDVGEEPDGIYFDPGTKRIFTNNHGTHDVTAIDAATGDVVGTVPLQGDGEQPVLAGGLIYVNSEEANEVVVFNPRTLKVVRRLPISTAKTPTGLAYDAASKRLFIACRNAPKMIAMDAESGKEIATLPIGAGADWAYFEADAKLIFVSTGEGVLNVFREKSPDSYEDAGAVKTQQSAKTMAFDPQTKKIFLPSVEYETRAAETPGGRPRRVVKPGSFALLVVAKHG